MTNRAILERAAAQAIRYLDSVGERRVYPTAAQLAELATLAELREPLG